MNLVTCRIFTHHAKRNAKLRVSPSKRRGLGNQRKGSSRDKATLKNDDTKYEDDSQWDNQATSASLPPKNAIGV